MRCYWKLFLSVLWFASLTACNRGGQEEPLELRSPSGEFSVWVYEAEFTDLTPRAGIVYLDLMNDQGQKIATERTRTSTVSKWSVGWLPGQDTIVLNSRDIGARAWGCDSPGFVEIEPDKFIQAAADDLHVAKYGQQ